MPFAFFLYFVDRSVIPSLCSSFKSFFIVSVSSNLLGIVYSITQTAAVHKVLVNAIILRTTCILFQSTPFLFKCRILIILLLNFFFLIEALVITGLIIVYLYTILNEFIILLFLFIFFSCINIAIHYSSCCSNNLYALNFSVLNFSHCFHYATWMSNSYFIISFLY